MGRPRKDTAVSAAVKIETAFWELMESSAYSKITIQKLAEKACVNRNAIYYHYENVEDVAQKAFQNFMSNDAIPQFICQLLSFQTVKEVFERNPFFLEVIRKFQLCAGSDSSYIRQMLKQEIKQIWLDTAKIEENQLAVMDTLCVEFALSGIIAVLGSKPVLENPFIMLDFPKTEIGRAVLRTMNLLSANKKSAGKM